jgi:hypothetical protein
MSQSIRELIALLQTEQSWKERRETVLSLAKRAEVNNHAIRFRNKKLITPQNDIPEPESVKEVAKQALEILLHDTEENACTALKLLVELHKHHR